MRRTGCALILATAMSASGGAAGRQGSVNIILANENGIVAVTDSRLSSGGHPDGIGQKLFRIDNHTICTIAGWFDSPGPTMDQSSYPAYTAITRFIRTRPPEPDDARALSTEQKLDQISTEIEETLQVFTRVEMLSGGSPSHTKIEITLAGIDGKRLKIAHVDLVPRLEEDRYVFERKNLSVQVVEDHLIHFVAGVRDVADPILTNPGSYLISDPVLYKYARAMVNDRGKSLSLDDMENIAKRLEEKTAECDTRVGDQQQIGFVKDGLTSVSQGVRGLLSPAEEERQYQSGYRTVYVFMNGQPTSSAAVIAKPPVIKMVMNSHFSNVSWQPLDSVFFFRTTFDHCLFYYGTSERFILDKSNTIANSTLRVGGGAVHPKAIEKMLRDFPGLKLDQSH